MVFYHKQGPANHYTCAVRRNSKWFHCNDGYVKEFNPTVIDGNCYFMIIISHCATLDPRYTAPNSILSECTLVSSSFVWNWISQSEWLCSFWYQWIGVKSYTWRLCLFLIIVSEIAYFFCRDRKGSTPSVDSILMQNDTSNESPVVVGKGKTVSKVPPETEMELESRKSEGDSSPPFVPI